ncbi:hypothetical protein V4P56_04040 [Bartonella sp. B35(2025)]
MQYEVSNSFSGKKEIFNHVGIATNYFSSFFANGEGARLIHNDVYALD